jgi:glycine cleavage system transcriptional repressor
MLTYALSAVGVDRPGIVAAIAEVMATHGVNVTDSQMAILRGHFAMTLIVNAPEDTDVEALDADLHAAGDRLHLEALTLRRVGELENGTEPSLVVSVYGADHPGILAAVTRALADAAVNICDVRTRLAGDVYAIFMEVAPPPGATADDVAAALAEPGRAQGVDYSVRPLDTDVL